jgi:HSP20 family molecular chaperone IbpA
MSIVSIHREKSGTVYPPDAPYVADATWWDPHPDRSELDPRVNFNPQFDIRETQDRLVIRADVPGVREQDLDVTLTDSQVVIRGRREVETDEVIGTCYSAERPSGGFTRTVLLPHRIEADHAIAELDKGVLRVVLPRASAPVRE